MQLRDLNADPGRRLGQAGRRPQREAHGLERAVRVAEELTRVRDACVAAETWTQRGHPVERREGLSVAAELGEGVADDAEVSSRGRRETLGTPTELERVAEAVARERQRAEPADGVRVGRVELQRAPERPLREPVVARIGGLADALLVGKAEQRERTSADRLGTGLRLEPADRRGGTGPGDSGSELVRGGGNACVDRTAGAGR